MKPCKCHDAGDLFDGMSNAANAAAAQHRSAYRPQRFSTQRGSQTFSAPPSYSNPWGGWMDNAMGLDDIEAGDTIFGDIADSAMSAASDALSSAGQAATQAATQAAQSILPGMPLGAPAPVAFRPGFVGPQAGPRLSATLLSPTGRVVASVPAFRPNTNVSLPMFQPAQAVVPGAPQFASASSMTPAQTPAQSTNTLLLAAAALGAVYLLNK
jgi:hypothetical protein